MGRFAGIEKEQPKAERLPKFTKGWYRLECIENCELQTKDGDALLSTFKILDSKGETALPAGTDAASKLIYFTGYWKARVADLVRGLTGSRTVTQELADKIFYSDNPAKGKIVELTVEDATSEESGNAYLRYTWKYVPQEM
jgi:hypothetical protein